MLWGAISYGRKYPLVKVDLSEGSLTGDRYRDEILRPHLAKHVAGLRRYGQRHVKVVEDGASVHWRKSTLTARRELRVNNLDHPPYSPDLNPIENMWAVLKRRLRQRSRIPTSEDEIWEAVQEEWEAIPIGTVNKLVEGMPKRVEALQRNRGYGIDW